MGKFDGIGAERLVCLAKIGGLPIAGNGMDEAIGVFLAGKLVVDLGTEVVCMGLSSVVATVLYRDNRSQHLALYPTQR